MVTSEMTKSGHATSAIITDTTTVNTNQSNSIASTPQHQALRTFTARRLVGRGKGDGASLGVRET